MRTYVLGAGSSVSAGAPLMRQFRDTAQSISTILGTARGTDRLREALEFWAKSVPGANIEEYYVLVDLMKRLGLGDSETTASNRLVENVKYLIAKTLQVKMGTEVSKIHKDFFQKIITSNSTRGDVISLNWDIAYDRAVARTYGQLSIDYGYQHAKPLSSDDSHIERPSFRLLKLHGSANWWYCDRCRTLWYDIGGKAVASYWEGPGPRSCPTESCGGDIAPLMVPPTGQKFEQSPFIAPMSEIWKRAREALLGCDEIVFIGYSFPPTDIQFRVFVTEALSKNANLKTIGVVTSPKFGSARNTFEDNYSSILSGLTSSHELRFRYFTFEQWVGQGCSLYDSARLD